MTDLRHGGEVKLGKKNIRVIYFLSRQCPCSQAHFDHLNQMQKDYPQYDFIAFHSSKTISKKKAREYFEKFKIHFPVVMDAELKFANLFEAVKTPHVYILGPEGEILYQGGATSSRHPKRAKYFYLRDNLQALSQNKTLPWERTKTLGCYIQR